MKDRAQWTNTIETPNLSVAAASPKDVVEMVSVYLACSYLEEWTGQPHTASAVADMLMGRDLPPGGQSEYNLCLAARVRETGMLAGFAQCYTAWPGENSFWIGLFLIDPELQGYVYGREFIDAILNECRKLGYEKAGLGVYLGNQKAVKFWYQNGFRRISAVRTEGEGKGMRTVMGLSQNLRDLNQ